MAGIDYTIPGQIKGIQIEPPENAMARAMQMRSMQDAMEMNALKKQEYERTRGEENELRRLFGSGLDPESKEFRNMLYQKAPGLAPAIEKQLLERGKTAAEIGYKQAQGRKEEAEALDKELTPFKNYAAMVATPEQAAAHTEAIYGHPTLGKFASKMMPKDQAIAQSIALFKQDPQRWMMAQTGVSGDKIIELTAKQEEARRKQQDEAYSDYVYGATERGEDILPKAAFLAQQTQQPPAAAVAPTSAAAPAAAPAVNALAPEVVPTADDGTRILPGMEVTAGLAGVHPQAAALYRTGNPRDKAIADAIQAAHVEQKKRQELTGEFANVELARRKIFELSKNPTPENLAVIADLKEQIKAAAKGKATNVNVNTKLGPQEQEFEKEIGSGQAKEITASKVKAEDARDILETARQGRAMLQGPIITGAGANFFVGLDQALKTAGMDFGGEASSNAQAYGVLMASNTARLIKNFGAGTGLSDADRNYAERMAAGDITVDKRALEKILQMQEVAATKIIERHNKKVAGVKTKVPLEVPIEPQQSKAEPVKKLEPFTDAEKERRYQEWKAKQKGK